MSLILLLKENLHRRQARLPSSLHRGIVHHEESGSWLLAAGTLVALEGDNDPHALLKNLLRDYLNNGVKALQRYDGHFALVIYNRLGRLPVDHLRSDGSLCNILWPPRESGIHFNLSAGGCSTSRIQSGSHDNRMFPKTGRSHGEKTFWQDVKRVRPATHNQDKSR